MESLFFISFITIVYTYFGYPIIIKFLSIILGKKVDKKEIFPSVSLIITAHNEESCIEKKIKNSLSLNYPKNKIEIIVASDSSSDRTNDIVRKYKNKNIILFDQNQRLGKTAAQAGAIELSNGEIIVLSDASTIYDKQAIMNLVNNFSDNSVGCVGGKVLFLTEYDNLKIEKNKIFDVEHIIRYSEAKLYSTICVSGCIYAIRRAAYKSIDIRVADDLGIPMTILMMKYRVVFEPNAIAFEKMEEHGINIDRNIRTINQGWVAIKLIFLNNIFMDPILIIYMSFVLISHKVLRWLTFIFLISFLISNLVLIFKNGNIFLIIFLISQIMFYGLAYIGCKFKIRSKFLKIPYSFCLYHYSSIIALLKSIKNEKIIIWSKS